MHCPGEAHPQGRPARTRGRGTGHQQQAAQEPRQHDGGQRVDCDVGDLEGCGIETIAPEVVQRKGQRRQNPGLSTELHAGGGVQHCRKVQCLQSDTLVFDDVKSVIEHEAARKPWQKHQAGNRGIHH